MGFCPPLRLSYPPLRHPPNKVPAMQARILSLALGLAAVTLALWQPIASRAEAPEAANSQKLLAGLERIEVVPQKIVLHGRRDRVALVVTGFFAGGQLRDLTHLARYIPSSSVVACRGHVVLPQENGQASVVVEVGSQRASVPVRVSGMESQRPVSFRYEVLVALTKYQCNSGACHGSPSGKGGFRLSLRAYDPKLDWMTLTREVYNRRTNVFRPEASLLLQKPVMEVAHGGGKRLDRRDVGYELLRLWVAQGMPADPPKQPECVRLEVYPKKRRLIAPAQEQQLRVMAHFSDGSARDVTHLADYSSSEEAVAEVDPRGRVRFSTKGEVAVLVRYLEYMETAHLSYLKPDPNFRWTNPTVRNLVDEHVFAKLRELEIPLSPPVSDAEFVRRVHLDLVGRLPTVEETLAFLNDPKADKRARLIDRLLDSEEFAKFWALKWADLLRVNNKHMSPQGVYKVQQWLIRAMRDNMPYDQFVAALLGSTGSTLANPPAAYYRAAKDVNDCTETTMQVFLGVRIQCAKCHNHPFERWTQDNYYGIAAFFNRVGRKRIPNSDEMLIYVTRKGEVTQPRTGQQMKPWLPLAGSVEPAPEEDRRQRFIAWLRQPDNPFFARMAVNRLWGHVFGRGIVEPVDDFRDSNPPSNPALLDALAREFVRSGYDRKHLLRLILNSRTYQTSSEPLPGNEQDVKYFSHYQPRMIQAEPLLDAVCQVTGVPEKFPGLPAGVRAVELPSPDVKHAFLKVFGQPAREMACQCERASDANLSQALQMINGDLVHAKLRHGSNRFRRAVKQGRSNEQIVEELYLAAYSRRPSPLERKAALEYIASQKERLQALEDLYWAVLNSKEFLFQH